MKKRSQEEQREYMRQYRARKRGMRPDEPGVTPPPKTPVVDTLDMSTAAPIITNAKVFTQAYPEGFTAEKIADLPDGGVVIGITDTRPKPSFLAAPDDDCASCGHDKQTYHLNAGGVCWAPAPQKRSRRCECPAFLDPSEPF